MKFLILFYSLLSFYFFISCSSDKIEDQNKTEQDLSDSSMHNSSELFTRAIHPAYRDPTENDSVIVTFDLEKITANYFNLIIGLDFYGGSWALSPSEHDFPYGIMELSLEKNKQVVMVDSIQEIPSPTYKNELGMDPYKIVQGKTTLIQKLQVLSADNFEVQGTLIFVLEPICTPTEFTFTISNSTGQLQIKGYMRSSPLMSNK